MFDNYLFQLGSTKFNQTCFFLHGGVEHCVETYRPTDQFYSIRCIPLTVQKPEYCSQKSWDELKNPKTYGSFALEICPVAVPSVLSKKKLAGEK